MEKKLIILLFFCVVALFAWVSSGFSFGVYSPQCATCHGDSTVVHPDHGVMPGTTDCSVCHVGDSIPTSTCAGCHPTADPGFCPLVIAHDDGGVTSCLACHATPCDEPEECETDNDCADGEVCEEGECVVASGCETDDDCADGEVCEEEVCVPSVGQECSETSDCAEGLVCEEGVCVAPGCETAADCDDADLCTTDECTAGECVNTEIDCGDDVCDSADGECVECLIDDDCEEDQTCTLNMCVSASGLCSLDKVTLKAGKKDFTDSIELKGRHNAPFVELLESVGSDIIVTLEGADDLIPDPDQTTYPFEVTESSLNTNKQKYTSPKQDKSVEPQTSFTLETKNNTMKLSVKKADLTGLKCPITFMLDFGGFSCVAEADELVNGNKPCPRSLLMGVEDYLDLNNVKAKQGSKVDSDTLELKGEFTVDGFDGSFDLSQPVVIKFGPLTFTVPGSEFTEKNGKYSCKKAESESDTGLVNATFDTVKATYTIKVKNATVFTGGGVGDYSINLFGFLIEAGAPVNLPSAL